ncbi:MAG: aldo/keto reductase [Chitinophagaceae bacterium]
MQYRKLGKSDLEISRVGFGCMSLKSDEQTNIRLLHAAMDKGINYFDTADIYDKGDNETLLGKAFLEKRSQVILATKVGNVWKADGSGLDWNPSKQHILESVEGSLRRLHTDYIDLYQLHGGTREDNIGEVIDAFQLLQGQGKIRYYGISSIRPNVIRQYVQRSHIVSLMSQYSLLDRRPEETVLPLMREHNVGVVVRGALASGLLVNKPAREYLGHALSDVAQAQQTIQSLTTEKRDATAVALQHVWHHPAVTSAIVGIRTEQQLDEAVKALDAQPLSAGQYQSLWGKIPAKQYEQYR